MGELTKLLSQKYGLPGRNFKTTPKEVQRKLKDLGRIERHVSTQELEEIREQELAPEFMLAKLALLRWDELHELAYRLSLALKAMSPMPRKISSDLLTKALREIGDSEWRKNKSYFDFLRDMRSERRDYEMINMRGRVSITRLATQ
jgi:hypothetical protein